MINSINSFTTESLIRVGGTVVFSSLSAVVHRSLLSPWLEKNCKSATAKWAAYTFEIIAVSAVVGLLLENIHFLGLAIIASLVLGVYFVTKKPHLASQLDGKPISTQDHKTPEGMVAALKASVANAWDYFGKQDSDFQAQVMCSFLLDRKSPVAILDGLKDAQLKAWKKAGSLVGSPFENPNAVVRTQRPEIIGSFLAGLAQVSAIEGISFIVQGLIGNHTDTEEQEWRFASLLYALGLVKAKMANMNEALFDETNLEQLKGLFADNRKFELFLTHPMQSLKKEMLVKNVAEQLLSPKNAIFGPFFAKALLEVYANDPQILAQLPPPLFLEAWYVKQKPLSDEKRVMLLNRLPRECLEEVAFWVVNWWKPHMLPHNFPFVKFIEIAQDPSALVVGAVGDITVPRDNDRVYQVMGLLEKDPEKLWVSLEALDRSFITNRWASLMTWQGDERGNPRALFPKCYAILDLYIPKEGLGTKKNELEKFKKDLLAASDDQEKLDLFVKADPLGRAYFLGTVSPRLANLAREQMSFSV